MTQSAQVLPLTGTWDLDPVHTRLGFAARHAMVATVHGHFAVFSGVLELDEADPAKSSAEVRIDAASITTGNDQRDAHLRSPDFLDVERYPELVFRSTHAEVGAGPEEYRLVGELTITDQVHPVVLELEYQGTAVDAYGNHRAGFEGSSTINRKDWGLGWNMVMEAGGLMLGDRVKLELDVSAIKRAEDASTA
jgi:polyisoprenoid-binding protein YceI